MILSERLSKLPPYLFVEINKKIEEKKKKGIDIVSFAIGDPDMPTPEHIIDELCKEAHNPVNHRYPETAGLPELCEAIAAWYKNRFDVSDIRQSWRNACIQGFHGFKMGSDCLFINDRINDRMIRHRAPT